MSYYPIIVLEGPDAVGKTTLASELCARLDAHYMHLTYRFKDRMHLYHSAAAQLCARRAQYRPVVLDRWWMSEVAYANAYRGGTRWPTLGRTLDRLARQVGVTYVLCLPEDRERYLAHFAEVRGRREEMYDSGMDRVYDEFDRILQAGRDLRRPDYLRYDLFEDGADLRKVVDAVLWASRDLRKNVGYER